MSKPIGRLARAAKTAGNAALVRANHPGRQTNRFVAGDPVPGPVILGASGRRGLIGEEETDRIIDDVVKAADLVREAGLDGVQIHSAHGFPGWRCMGSARTVGDGLAFSQRGHSPQERPMPGPHVVAVTLAAALLVAPAAFAKGISTHVLDVAHGAPGPGIEVVLEREASPGVWSAVGRGKTDKDGRVRDFGVPAAAWTPGSWRLTFHLAPYWQARKVEGFFPVVQVQFRVVDASEHFHVPIVVSPYGYSTYRGS